MSAYDDYTALLVRAARLKAEALRVEAEAYRVHPTYRLEKREQLASEYEGMATSMLDIADELERAA